MVLLKSSSSIISYNINNQSIAITNRPMITTRSVLYHQVNISTQMKTYIAVKNKHISIELKTVKKTIGMRYNSKQ